MLLLGATLNHTTNLVHALLVGESSPLQHYDDFIFASLFKILPV